MTSHPLPEPVDVARTDVPKLLAAITALERALAAPARDPVWVVRVQARNRPAGQLVRRPCPSPPRARTGCTPTSSAPLHG